VRVLLAAAQEIECGLAGAALAVTCDRTSNGPHLYYPNPRGPGGTGAHEDWVMDNFSCDPLGRHAMVTTAENVAKKHGIDTAAQIRVHAYSTATLADDAAFHKRFDALFPCPSRLRRTDATLPRRGTAVDGRSAGELKPVVPGGSVTFGGQTHPADGNAAIVLTSPERARELSRDAKIRIRLHGFGQARAPLAFMPEAPLPATQRALAQAGLGIEQMQAIKMHNPFAVNDIVFARATGVDLARINNYGCSLVWGHPQAPMGTRSIIELIEELVLRGGGYGLFTGCAAGDTAMAVVLEVAGG
jgi:acetyl-CoA acetyltransferase